MSVRATSYASWRRINEDGLLSRRRLEVYNALAECNEDITANELGKRMFGQYRLQQMNLTTRLGELRDMGVVIEAGARECTVSGMTVTVWRVVDQLPKPYEKKETQLTRKELTRRLELARTIFARVDQELKTNPVWVKIKTELIHGTNAETKRS